MPNGGSRVLALAVAAAAILLASTAPRAAREDNQAALVQGQLGDLLFRDGRFRDAAKVYERAYALAAAPLQAHLGQQWVKSLLRTTDFRKARDVAAAVAENAPGEPELMALQGDALWAAGQFDDAEERYRQSVAVQPTLPRGRSGVARSLLSRSQLEEGLTEALAAVNAAPEEPDLYPTVFHAYQRLRRYSDAANALATYVELLPFKDTSDGTIWARQQIRFMRAFGKATPLQEPKGNGEKVHVVPFRIERDKILLDGRVNGDEDVEFVLDTGAEMSVITKPLADRLRVRPDIFTLSAGVGGIGMRGLLVGRLSRLQIGTLDVKNVPTLIKSPALIDLPTHEQEGFNPLALGYSMTVDYRNRVLTMSKTMPEPAEGAHHMPLRVHRLAMVKGVINRDNHVPFVVDTGGEVISLSRSTATALRLEPPRHIALKVYGTSGWDPTAFLLPGLHLAFNRVQLENQAVVVLDLDAPSALLGFELGGIVGHRFLSKYRVTVDLPRSEMRLE
jgi:tetratricopeptide (TPR) repeat protein/predicted aspartyl protease